MTQHRGTDGKIPQRRTVELSHGIRNGMVTCARRHRADRHSGYHEEWPSATLNVVWITIGLVVLLGHRLSDSRNHRRRHRRRGVSPAAG